MRKVINIAPAEEIIIVDGEEKKEYTGIFNMRCLFCFQNKMSEIGITTSSIEKVDLLALCVYSAVNACGELEYSKAEALSKKMSPASGSEIIRMFNKSLMGSMDEKQRAVLKKVMARNLINATNA